MLLVMVQKKVTLELSTGSNIKGMTLLNVSYGTQVKVFLKLKFLFYHSEKLKKVHQPVLEHHNSSNIASRTKTQLKRNIK